MSAFQSTAESSELAAVPPIPRTVPITAPNPIRASFAVKRSPAAAMRDRMRAELRQLLSARENIDREAQELARRRHEVQLTIDVAVESISRIDHDGLVNGADDDERAGPT